MTEVAWIMGGIAAVIVALGIVFIWKLKKKEWKHQPNYRALFIMGVIFVPMWVVFDNPAFLILPTICIIVSLVHRKEWDKPQPVKYSKAMMVAVLAGLVALIIGVIMAFLMG